MTRFAENTTVAVEKTRVDIETLLGKHKATQRIIAIDEHAGIAIVGFTMAERQIRMRVPLPKESDVTDAKKRPSRWWSMSTDQRTAWIANELDQAHRTRWRGVLLIVKAKLELVELGLSTVEREFLADIALPDGGTVGDLLLEQIAKSYATGTMPPLLGMGPSRQPIDATLEDS